MLKIIKSSINYCFNFIYLLNLLTFAMHFCQNHVNVQCFYYVIFSFFKCIKCIYLIYTYNFAVFNSQQYKCLNQKCKKLK